MSDNKYSQKKVDDQGVEYYAPDMDAPEALNIPDQNIEDKDEFETRLDSKVVFNRIAKDLYKTSKSAIRELLVNAIGHGCAKANEKYGEENSAYVDIHLHPNDRKLVITDVNGVGMTYKHIVSILSVVGRSGNFDSETAGQFGMGFFAFLKISDTCILHSRVREPYEYKGNKITAISMLNQGGWQWQKINSNDEDVPLENPGTEIRLTLNQDITISDVIDTIKHVSRYQLVKVKLYLDDDYNELPAGEIPIEQTGKLEDIIKLPEDAEVIELDDQDIYFKGVMFKESMYGGLASTGIRIKLLARVPIDIDIDDFVPKFSAYVLNIKNERKFIPAPDRERLAEKSENILQEKLKELFAKHFNKLNVTRAEDLDEMELKYPVLYMKRLGIESYINAPTVEFVSNLQNWNVQTIRYDEKDKTTNYADTHSLLKVLSYRKDCIIVHSKSYPPIRAVCEWAEKNNKPKKHFIRINHKSAFLDSILENWKIPTLKDFMKDNKIKNKVTSNGGKTVRSKESVATHFRGLHRREIKWVQLEDINFESTIFIKNGTLNYWTKILTTNICQPSGSISFAKWTNTIQDYADENKIGLLTERSFGTLEDFDVYGIDDKDYTIKKMKMSEILENARNSAKGPGKSWYSFYGYSVNKTILDDENALNVIFGKSNGEHIDDKGVTYKYRYKNPFIILFDEQEPVIKIKNSKNETIELSYLQHFKWILQAMQYLHNTKIINKDYHSEKNLEKNVFYKNIDVQTVISLPNTIYSINDHVEYCKYLAGIDGKIYNEDCTSWLEKSYTRNWNYSMEVFQKLANIVRKSINATDEQKKFIIHVLYASDSYDCRKNIYYDEGSSILLRNEGKELIKQIVKLIPPNVEKESIDLFFAIKDSLKRIGEIEINQDTNSNKGELAMFNDWDNLEFLLKVKKLFLELKSKFSIDGKISTFIERMITKNANVIKDDPNEVIISLTDTTKFREIDAIVSLHTSLCLDKVDVKTNKLIMKFSPRNQILSTDRFEKMKLKCPCGCDNFVHYNYVITGVHD